MTTSDSDRGPNAAAADAWRLDARKAVKAYPEKAEELAKASAVLAAGRLFVVQKGFDRAAAAQWVKQMEDRLANNIEHGKTIPDVRVRTPNQERDR